MSDLTNSIFQQLDQSHIESIAGQLGIDPGQAGDAIQQALPLLIGGLARNSNTPQGAESLFGALQRNHAGIDVGGLLGSIFGGGGGSARSSSADIGAVLGAVLGGSAGGRTAGGGMGDILGAVLGGGGSPASNGAGILSHIFGGRLGQAQQGLGQTTGLGGAGAGQLLAMLAPLVMAVLGNMTRKQGLDANGLSGVLGQERNRLQQGGVGSLLTGVLDRDGDGEIGLDEMMQAGAGLLGMLGKR
ncbi:MAG TPA: DUF937 domain-containing protein [Dokdonella sp.]|uniref:DUF937 domain-containing protein n=1 Tax=Dokdonella sp. TaxID=2291710 RepID=UPI0025C23D92|nr:DUF937 domain-containing protein [Dokdonella sp.]MBX3691769.1 DUF937 domain-containing protein [Dokdonella sp.]MCW5568096.1 DUF937 domain-containing protein [Dokdonella sp.]HNR92242.1 DUF937 domain-containing protein [Dokdonella sp.]